MSWIAFINVSFWFCKVLFCNNHMMAVGEGCISTVADARADLQHPPLDTCISAKSHSGKAKNMGYSKTGKRSFKRAFLRSIRDGFTTYHGRFFTPTDFNLPLPTLKPQVKSDVRMPSPKSSGAHSRLSVFCWNMGGLSSDRYQCLLEWLRSCQCDVVCIQETHWKFTSTWTTEHYHAVHSGDTTSHAGLLTLISKKLLRAESLSWTERVPGRLVQLKLRGRSQDLDIIHCYQYVHKPTKMEDRDAFWTELQNTLVSLPTRNRCCLLGDFNTTIPVANAKVGHKDFLHQGVRQIGPSHKDWKSFHHLVELFDLNILNSWSDIGPTYEHEGGASRIDFILCRNLHTDMQSKQVKYLHHHPMYQTTGCRHVPMITTISSRWIPQQTQSPFHWNRHLKQSAYKHYEQNTTQWQQQVESIRGKVTDLSMTEYVEDFSAFHRCINDCIAFTKETSLTTEIQMPRTVFQQFLRHSKLVHDLDGTDLNSCFQAWFHCSQKSRLRKQMNQVNKHTKKRRQWQILQQARDAVNAKDMRKFYNIIRRLAPKTPKKPILLRSDQGQLLGAEEAADLLQTWFASIYADDSKGSNDTNQIHFQWIFDRVDIYDSLTKLNRYKAVSPHYMPAPYWRALEDTFADKLVELGIECQLQGKTPVDWGTSTVTFLSKPGKQASHPSGLRPICLLEPFGKTVMHRIGRAMREQVMATLVQFPLYAYIPGRSSEDAILKLMTHIDAVSSSSTLFRHKIHLEADGYTHGLSGGLIISLDLSRAFDEVPRGKLFRSLSELGIDENLIGILMHIYSDTKVEFAFKNVYRSFRAAKGIRQGCSAAPTLWILYTLSMLQQLSHCTSLDWVQQALTIYADDICVHFLYWSMEDFESNISKVGKLFDVLEAFGMTINYSKTAAMSQCRGRKLSKFNSKYIHRTTKGTFLRIPRTGDKSTEILLKKSHTYLGVVLTYRNASQLTMQCRISAAKRSEGIMHKWIYTHKGFSRAQRLMLWFQCIFPSVSAGILAVGVNQGTLQRFDAYCMHSLRKIYRQPVHIELLSHADFLARFRIRDPLKLLWKLCHKMIIRHQERALILTSQDILQTATVGSLTDSLSQIERSLVHRRSQVGPPVSHHSFQCHICSATFETTRGLNEHLVKSHQDYTGKQRHFQPEVDLADGVPTCSRCGQIFSSWGAIRHHIEYRCLLPAPGVQWAEKNWQSTELLKYASNVVALSGNKQLCHHFDQHCSICGQFHSNKAAMKHHWKLYHPHEFQKLYDVYQSICDSIHFYDPCQFCCRSFPSRTHECTVIQNLAMLSLMPPKKKRRTQDGPGEPPSAATDTAGTQPDETGAVGRTFDILRDQGPGFQCTHCLTSFPVSSALKRHIEQHCQVFDPNKPHFVQQGLDNRVIQSVKDHMISNLLEDDELLKMLNRQCCLCKQVFGRRGELLRHLQQQHAVYWVECQDTVQSLDATCRGPTFRCYCQPPRYRKGQASKHQCVIFYQVALLMKHEQIEYSQQLVQMDQRYAATLEAARQQSERPNRASGPEDSLTGRTLDNYFARSSTATSMDQASTDQALQITVEENQTEPIPADSTTDPQVSPLAELDSSDTEDITTFIDYDQVVTRAIDIHLDFASETFQHWHWVLTTNMSEVADQLQLNDFYSTLYPTTSLNLTGGFYAQWLDDPTIVRLLRTRCCICDATFNDATDMFYHHNLAHGCLPKWYLRNFDYGLKTLLWHLIPITTLAISDQEILQLCQLVVLRIHCAFTFSHGGSGYLSADVCHLGGCHPKRPTEKVHGYGRRGTGEKAQRIAINSLTRRLPEAPIQSDPDDDDHAPATRGLDQMSTGGYGVRHPPEHWRRKHSPRDDGSHQSLAIEQGEGHATKTPSGLHNGDYTAKQISEAGGLNRRQSTPTECQEGQFDGLGWQVPLSGVEPRSEKAGDIENPSIDSGRDILPSGEHSDLPGGSKSHTSISQSQEAGWRSTESSPIPLGGLEQSECRDLAPPAKAVLSCFLATYPDEFEAGHPSKIPSCSAAAEGQEQSVRVFCNSDGVSCYLNSFCIGLTWLGLHFDSTDLDSSATDFGVYLKTCVQPTLVPLDVHLDFKDLLGNWLNSTRKGRQQDIHEFAEYFIGCLKPVEIDGTWWPKWSLSAGPAVDQPMDDYARGGKENILSLTLPNSAVQQCTLQELINLWHDDLGMCNVFTQPTAGKLLHVDRQKETVKDLRTVLIPAVIQLPHSTTYHTDTQWIDYQVRALTYHKGDRVTSGHYRTLLKQHQTDGTVKWFDYEDSKLPDIVAECTTFHLQNVTLIWLHRKQDVSVASDSHTAQDID